MGVRVVCPSGRFVVAGSRLEASVEDADEAVADLSEGGVVTGLAGALLVVVAAGSRRGPQGGECLGLQRVGEPVVADVAGLDGVALGGGPGDRAGAGLVFAGFRVGVSGRASPNSASTRAPVISAMPGIER